MISMADLTALRTAHIAFALSDGTTIEKNDSCRVRIFSVIPGETYKLYQSGGNWMRLCSTIQDPASGVTVYNTVNGTLNTDISYTVPSNCYYLLVYYSWLGDKTITLNVNGKPGSLDPGAQKFYMYIGSDLISSIYMGNQEVAAMYLGNIKIW